MDSIPLEAESSPNEIAARILSFVVRRRRWIVIPACVTTLLACGVLALLPNHYTSDATLLVVQQQVPERYVVPTSSTGIAEALQAMKEQVLSRTRLLAIIDEFNLYSKQSKRMAPEQLVDLMRRNIDIDLLNSTTEKKDFNAFKISFTAENAQLAQNVTSRLTSLFINENTKIREEQAKNTTNFLSSQLQAASEKLQSQEEKLRDYKMQHLGELPEQQQGNLSIMTGIQSQLQNTQTALSRAQEQRVYLQSMLDGYHNLSARGVSITPTGEIAATPLQTAQRELVRLQTERDKLLDRYTPQHPDVVDAEQRVAKQQRVVDRLQNAKPDNTATARAAETSLARPEDEAAMAQIKSQLAANKVEIERLRGEGDRLKSEFAQYQNRLNATPVRQQQMAEVTRDYDLTKKEYADLLNNQQQAQMATSLEKQQAGQQFRIVDPPSLPVVPSNPKRMKIGLGAIFGGLVLGVALAFLMEMRKPTFQAEKDVLARLSVPLVLGVPLMLTPAERRKRDSLRMVEWAAGLAMLLVMAAAEFYVHKLG